MVEQWSTKFGVNSGAPIEQQVPAPLVVSYDKECDSNK